MKALVTGGAGFIGSNLVEKLLSFGYEVTVIDNESSDSHESFYWNDEANNYKLDICDYENTKDLYKGIDYVFHLAAEARIQPAIINPLLAFKTNTLGTATVLQCAREAGVKRVVYSSTSSAYGRKNSLPNVETQPDDCLNPYSVAKVAGEKACKMYYDLFGLETVILRYFNVYGNHEPRKGPYAPVIGLFDRQMRAGEPMTIVGDGEQRRDFTNVYDVVEANILAATSKIDDYYFGTVFNIGCGKNYSVKEIAEIFGGEYTFIPPRLGEAKETLANNSKAKKVLEWAPQHSIVDYIQQIKL